ncbi:MAG: AAA family ATPase, partial [Deltaproteobacteria bacterium]|nr:AAA family ATPase [Deltaproteobacteria bacterium]
MLKPPRQYVPRAISAFIEASPDLEYDLINSLADCLNNYVLSHQVERPPETKIAMDTFSNLFKLDDNALNLIEIIFICKMSSIVHSYFSCDLDIFRLPGRAYLASALDISIPTLKDTISKLDTLGIINTDNGLSFQSDDLLRLWEMPEGKNPEDLFCSPLVGDILPLTDFSVDQDQVSYLLELLRNPLKRAPHILLYGSSGTGKSTFARSLASVLKVRAWGVASPTTDVSGLKRRMALTVCANMASADRGSLVVADEAEALLSDLTRYSASEKSFDKSWINEFMETPGNPVIWIVNYPEKIDQSTRRRFSFALHFRELNLSERRKMWEGILAKYDLSPPVGNKIYKDLVTKQRVPAAVIEMGVGHATEIGGGDEKLWENIEMSVKSFTLLQKNGEKTLEKNGVSPNYTPAGVTAGIDANTLAERLKGLECLRTAEGLPPGAGTLLFYGPPGTGKTALARYLASALEKELIIKKASSIIDCWVGSTEKNIADAFREAEDEDAV